MNDTVPNATADLGDATLATRLAEAEAKAAEHWDRLLRLQAESDNARKRLERDLAAARRYAAESLLADLLAVADSLELGLRAASDRPEVKAVAEGMKLTQQQLLAVLARHGVTPVEPQGQAFDPSFHEAVAMVESATSAPGSVVEVMQKGYRLHERLLRPARVVVARAPAGAGDGDTGALP